MLWNYILCLGGGEWLVTEGYVESDYFYYKNEVMINTNLNKPDHYHHIRNGHTRLPLSRITHLIKIND